MLLVDRVRIPALRLARHRANTALAMLVAACGVALIVSLAALLGGLKRIGAEALLKGGANVIRVIYGNIKPEDIEAFAASDPAPRRVAAVSGYSCSVRAGPRGERRAPGVLMGTVPAVLEMYGLEVEQGRPLGLEDADPRSPGCVIDGGLAAQLFPRGDGVGQPIQALFGDRQVEATVRGVLPDLNAKAPLGLGGKIPSRTIYLHREAINAQTQGVVHTLLLEAPDFDSVAPLVSAAETVCAQRWPGQHARVKHRQKQVKNLRAFTLMIDGLGVAIAIVTLVSCVLSIATLQLLALRGRVGEVAVRVIEGATGEIVALQLVVESMLTTGIGALLGLPFGYGLALWLSTIVDWPVVFSPSLALASLLVASGAGVLAGALPAFRAANMDPVHALKISQEAGC